MSICPKNKSSKGRRDKRRANWKMSAPTLVKCSKCGALMMPHRVCKACGSYNKKEIIAQDQKSKKTFRQESLFFTQFFMDLFKKPLRLNKLRIKITTI